MPEATLDAVADHGAIRGDTIRGEYAEAPAGHDGAGRRSASTCDDVVDVLEIEGVEKFETSWNDLLKSTRGRARAAGQGGQPVERQRVRTGYARADARRRERPDRAWPSGSPSAGPHAVGPDAEAEAAESGWAGWTCRRPPRRCCPSCASCASG